MTPEEQSHLIVKVRDQELTIDRLRSELATWRMTAESLLNGERYKQLRALADYWHRVACERATNTPEDKCPRCNGYGSGCDACDGKGTYTGYLLESQARADREALRADDFR